MTDTTHLRPADALPRDRSAPSESGGRSDFQIEARPSPGIHWITVEGELSFDQLLSLLHVLGVESETQGRNAMLLDLRNVGSAFANEELAIAGREIACSFLHLGKLALLVPGSRVTGVSERVARREGMNMRVFTTERSAVAWLANALEP